jgi:D-alanine-D-alanine ligase
MKQTLDAHQLPTPKWQVFETGDEPIAAHISYPSIVKLAKEHCSIGLGEWSIVNTSEELIASVRKQLITYNQPVIVEEFLSGREFQITVIEEEQGIRMLPPAEVTYKVEGTKAMLSYESRWNETHPDFHTSGMELATLTTFQEKEFARICIAAFKAFDFSDFTRIDARLNSKNELMILEANANPGLSHDPLYGMTVSYMAAGMTFADFVWKIVSSCVRRIGV